MQPPTSLLLLQQHSAPRQRLSFQVNHVCGKKGHITKACHSKREGPEQAAGRQDALPGSSQHTHQLTAEDSQADDGSYSLFMLSAPTAAPIKVMMTVDEADVTMDVDTRASISVMNKSTFMDTWKGRGPRLQPSSICEDLHGRIP